MSRTRAAWDDGFTLVELLIVIVILGILSAIVVFAVGSTRGDATAAACGHDRKVVETALEAYNARTGAYPSSLSDLGGASGALKNATISGNDLTTDEYTVRWDDTANTLACDLTTSPGGGTPGGSTAGGSTAGGSTAGGSTAGGSTAGGSTAGGSTAGGSTAGGSTAGGSTAGGSTAGGSTAGGSTAGGSTAGGATTGGAPVDTVSPTTTASITAGTAGLSGWRTSAVTLTLIATDAGTPTSGVSSITYRMTGATTQAAQTVSASMTAPTISADGTTTVFFLATDTAGNAEAEKSFMVKVDKTAPTGLTVSGPGNNDKKPQFSGKAGTSTAGSGDILTVTVKVLSGAATAAGPYTAAVNASTGNWGSTSYGSGAGLPNGNYTAQVTQSDAAGNATTVTLNWTA